MMEVSFSEKEAEFSANDQRIKQGAMFILGFIGGTLPFANDAMRFLGGCTCGGLAGLGMYMVDEQGPVNPNGQVTPEDLTEESIASVEGL